MSKHTDGPWSFVVSDEDEYDITPTNDIGGVVAIAYDEANAKLIAAAPELLAACTTMAEWFKREHDGFPNAGQVRTTPAGEAAWRKWWEENLRLCDLAKTQANAAIAKATA